MLYVKAASKTVPLLQTVGLSTTCKAVLEGPGKDSQGDPQVLFSATGSDPIKQN